MLGLGAVLGLAVGVCGGFWKTTVQQGPPEPAIQVPPALRPADPSSWTLLRQAMEQADEDDQLSDLFNPAPPAPEELHRWRGDADALALLDRVAQREGLSTPISTSWNDPAVDLSGLMELRASQRLRAADLEHQGRHDEALAVLLDILRLGALLKDSEVPFLGYLFGVVWMDTTDLHAFGLRHSRDPALQATLAEALASVVTAPSGPRAIASECRIGESMIRSGEILEFFEKPALPLMQFDVDQTISWLRRDCRLELEQAIKPLPERVPSVRPPYWEGAGPRRFLHNPVGRQLLDNTGVGLLALLPREDEVLVQLAALKALTAIRSGLDPDLTDPLGGAFEVTETELLSAHDGLEFGRETPTLRWPIH